MQHPVPITSPSSTVPLHPSPSCGFCGFPLHTSVGVCAGPSAGRQGFELKDHFCMGSKPIFSRGNDATFPELHDPPILSCTWTDTHPVKASGLSHISVIIFIVLNLAKSKPKEQDSCRRGLSLITLAWFHCVGPKFGEDFLFSCYSPKTCTTGSPSRVYSCLSPSSVPE